MVRRQSIWTELDPGGRRRIFLDKWTDIAFWWTGMYAAYLAFLPRDPVVGQRYMPFRRPGIFGFLVLITLLDVSLFRAWIDQKLVVDSADLPRNYQRLCNYDPAHVAKADDRQGLTTFALQILPKERVHFGLPPRLEKIDARSQHCLIRGGSPLNRSLLAASLAAEYASKGRPTVYLTAAKILEARGETIAALVREHPKLDCVVVDDLSTKFDESSPNFATFASLIRDLIQDRNTSTVWALEGSPGQPRYDAWRAQILAACQQPLAQFVEVALAGDEAGAKAGAGAGPLLEKVRKVSDSPLIEDGSKAPSEPPG